LLRGSLDAEIAAAAEPLLTHGTGASIIDVRVPGDVAVPVGLSCGGQATVVVTNVCHIPEGFWAALRNRTPLALAARSSRPETVLLVTRDSARVGSLGDADLDERVERRARLLLSEGVPAAERVHEEVLLQTFHPPRRLMVVGAGELATAISAQATLLDWESTIVNGLTEAEQQLGTLGPSDGLVVLTHSATLDAPILAHALRSGVGYVGALGSRGTQARRADQLRDHGISEQEIESIYGPIGLDIRASTPGETAVAICAEILAVAAGRPAISLRDSQNPIHSQVEVSTTR